MPDQRRGSGGRGRPKAGHKSGQNKSGQQAPAEGVEVRRVAAEALVRIEQDDAYANLALPKALERSELDQRDRGLVTELVYGVTRMRRALDWVVDRYLVQPPDLATRTVLRIGAYQLLYLRVPAHAAVSVTVSAAPKRTRGFVNAVLRKVAAAQPPVWPDDATRLSYPNWIVDRLTTDLGHDDALGALTAMDERAEATTRDDGYTQDRASQWVSEAVGALPGERILDAAAAPGGKATAMAASGATIVAADVRPSRVGLIRSNVEQLALSNVAVVTADALRPPFVVASFDRVLLDAPCSGLGTLGRRADARWRLQPDSIARLAELQRSLIDTLLPLVRPGGTFVYSVCTLSAAETTAIDEHLARTQPDLVALAPPGPPWQPAGRGARLLPQTEGTDGMYVLRFQRPGCLAERSDESPDFKQHLLSGPALDGLDPFEVG